MASERVVRRDSSVGNSTRLRELVAAVNEECVRHVVLPRHLVVPVATLVVSEDPPVEMPGLIQMVTTRLWCAAFDDVFDRGLAARERMVEIAEGCRALARDTDSAQFPEAYAQTLFQLLAPSRSAPLWEDVRPVWSDLFTRFVDGSWFELERSSRAAWPSLDEYLAHARHSIALPWLVIAETPLLGDPRLDDLSTLSDLAVQCGLAVRLANDLASFERETGETTLNAVALLVAAADPGASLRTRARRARAVLAARLDREVGSAHRLGAALRPASPARRFLHAMDVDVQAYAQGDPRDWQSARNMEAHAR